MEYRPGLVNRWRRAEFFAAILEQQNHVDELALAMYLETSMSSNLIRSWEFHQLAPVIPGQYLSILGMLLFTDDC